MATLTKSSKFCSAGVLCRSLQAFNHIPKGLSINKQTLHLNGQHFCIWEAQDPTFKFQYRGQLPRPSCFASFLSYASPTTRYQLCKSHNTLSVMQVPQHVISYASPATRYQLCKSRNTLSVMQVPQHVISYASPTTRYQLCKSHNTLHLLRYSSFTSHNIQTIS